MKTRLPKLLLFFLLFLLGEFLLSFGTSSAYAVLQGGHEVLGFLILTLFESLILLLLHLALGAALCAVTKGVRRGVYLLLLASAARFFGTQLTLLWRALFFGIAIDEASLAALLGSVLDGALLPLFVAYFLSLLFLKDKTAPLPHSPRDTAAPLVQAAIAASSLIFVYRLVGQVVTAVGFVQESFGFVFLKTGEKVMLILDFIPVFAVSAMGYFLILWGAALYDRLPEGKAGKDT